MSGQDARFGWVDIAKGLSILLVVMMHSAYGVGEATGEAGVLNWVVAWASPFRMPEFFLISGLFLSRVIDRDWLRYADRRVVHYLYFYLLWAAIHIGFKVALGAYGAGDALSYLLWAPVVPYGVLWFIYMLAAFAAATKLLHMLGLPHWFALAAGAVLQIAPVESGVYVLDQFAEYFVYFYAGYALAPQIFRLADWAGREAGLAAIGLLAWLAIHTGFVFAYGFEVAPSHSGMGLAGLPGLHLVFALLGSAALCVFSALLARVPAMDWLRRLGARSIVGYLAFALPMGVTREVLLRLGLVTDASLLGLLVMASAVIAPLVLYWLVERTGWGRFLFERPAWAHLPGTPGSRRFAAEAPRMPAE